MLKIRVLGTVKLSTHSMLNSMTVLSKELRQSWWWNNNIWKVSMYK